MTTFRIRGLGTARPPSEFHQHAAATEAEHFCCHTAKQRRTLHRIYRQSTVQRRGTVLREEAGDVGARRPQGGAQAATAFYPLPDDADDRGPTVAQRMALYASRAVPLARAAAETALDRADASADAITHLVTVSCTGFGAPGVDVQLIDALGLRPDVSRTMIGFMGCHGAINGLRTADGLARQRVGDKVLVCCVELCSLHFQYGWDAQRVVANALFADGAAAVVGEVEADTDRSTPSSPHALIARNGNGQSRVPSQRAAREDGWALWTTGSYIVPDSHKLMTWSIGDHGFEMTLSPGVPEVIERQLEPWVTRWLGEQGLTIAQVGSWVVHPGGPRILDAVERSLLLPGGVLDVSRDVLAACGNMSSPTVLFILDRLRAHGASRPCVILAFGPGLTIEAALLV